MKLNTVENLRTMSGEQLLLCRICAVPEACGAIERELDRRSVVAKVTEILTHRPSRPAKQKQVA
jgi:hypothetical protein